MLTIITAIFQPSRIAIFPTQLDSLQPSFPHVESLRSIELDVQRLSPRQRQLLDQVADEYDPDKFVFFVSKFIVTVIRIDAGLVKP